MIIKEYDMEADLVSFIKACINIWIGVVITLCICIAGMIIYNNDKED